jgi:hypothetical protein
MAKGQQRSNREAKKPKAPVKKPTVGAIVSQYQLPAKSGAAKGTVK